MSKATNVLGSQPFEVIGHPARNVGRIGCVDDQQPGQKHMSASLQSD
jgi:hypothetical protein